jgi:outer membrane protein assembly factor BamA/autotransporter translocation and assembly factor TamB
VTRRRRSVLLWGAGLGAVALLLVTFGYFPQEPLRGYVERRLQQGLGPGSRIRGLHVVPGRLSADVYGLVIEGPTYRLTAPRARLVLAPEFLGGRSLSFRVVEVEQPVLEMWPGPPGTGSRPLDQPLVIGDLKLSGGSVVYRTADQGTFVVRNIVLSGAIGMGTVTVGASGGEWRREPTPVGLGPATGVVRISSALDITIDSLTASVAQSEVHLSGRLGRAGDLTPDLEVDADVALADLGLFGAPGMRGRATARGRLKGFGEDLAVEADVEGEDVRIAGWPVERVSGRVEQAGGRTSADLVADLLGGRAEGEVQYTRGGPVSADLRLQSIRTARLRAQGIDLGVPFDGLVSGNVTAEGTTDSVSLDADLTASGAASGRKVKADLEATGRASLDRRSVDLRYALTLDASGAGGGMPRIDDIHLVSRGTATGALPPAVAGDYEGHVVLATIGGPERVPVSGRFRNARGTTSFTLAARALGGALDAEGETRGSVVRRLVATGRSIDLRRLHASAGGEVGFRLNASGPIDRLTGTANLDVADLTWNGGRIGPVTAQVTGRAGAGRMTLAIPELHAAGQGTYDTRTLHATLRLDETPLERLAALSPPPDPITGATSGTVDLTMPFADPDALVVQARLHALDVTRGRLAARAVRPFSATYRGRRLSLAGLEMAGEGVTLAGDASFGLDPAAPVEGMVRFDLDLSRLPTREGWSVTGRAEGDVELTGTRVRPRAYGTVLVSGVEVRDADSTLLALANGQIDLAGDAAHVPGLRAEVPGGFLELAGRVPLAELLPEPAARALGLEAAGPIQARLRFDVDLGQMNVRPPWHVDGRAQGDVELVGPRARPRAYGAVTLTDVYAEHPAAPPLTVPDARIELNGDEAAIPGLRARIADGILDLEGRIPVGALLSPAGALRIGVAPGGEADLKATLTGVQASTLLQMLRPDSPSRIQALITGEARLMGTLTTWREAHGELRLTASDVTVQDLAVEVTPLAARLQAGRVDFDPLEVRARGGVFTAGGSADLFARTMDVAGRGTLDLRTISPFVEEAVLTGDAEVDVIVRGPLAAPRPTGSVVVRDATLRLRDIRQPLSAINGTLVLDEGLVRVEGVTAMLGGGPARMEGTARVAGLGVEQVNVSITGEGLGIRYPVARSGGRAEELFEELKARVNADLTLTGRTGDLLLAGTLRAERSLYDSDIFLDEGILPPDVPPEAVDGEGSRLLQSIGLDVEISTDNPFLVRNNLAQLEAEGTLRLRGSMDEPAPFGRFDVRPGGKVFLQEREFAIQSGRIAYDGTTDPEIAITATTVIGQPDGDYQVTVVATGPLETPVLTLRSSPALSEREIASLIATGRTDVALTSGAWVVGEQAAALLAGRFTRAVARELIDLGLDQVDIQPELLAREGEPSARFTFGKQIGRTLRLVYSTSLSDPEAQYYQALFRFREGMELSAKLQRRFDGTYTYSLGQRLRFGASGAPVREAREFEAVELSAIRVEGGLREFPAVVEEAKAKPGKDVTYWDLLDDADRIREELVRLGHIEAVIDARLDGTQAVFGGDVGPRYRWRVEGMAAPPDLTGEIEAALFEEEAVERGRARLIEHLNAAGHLRASVEASSVPEDGWRTLVFRAEPGPVLRADVRFPGATLLSHAELLDAVGGPAVFLTAPRDAERAIRTAYRARHRLAAKVGPVQTADQPGRVTVVVPVDEGPAARIVEIEYRGSTLERATLDTLANIPVGSEYDPLATSNAVLSIREQYLRKGFPAVRVVSRLEPVEADLRLVFNVAEGPRILVGNVEIVGLRRTRRSLVEREIDLPPGEPLDARKLAVIERRLTERGIFRRVVVTALPGTPATIRVEVEEDARYLAAYDVRYNVEEGATGLVDGEMRNVMGLGVALGARVRLGRDLREVRGSISAPSFVWGGDDLTASAYTLRDFQRVALELPPTAGELVRVSFEPGPLARRTAEGPRRETGFQLQQALHLIYPWDLLYGYRFKRTTCPGQGIPPLSRDRRRRLLYDPCETPLIRAGGDLSLAAERTVDVAGVDLSAVRDTRDSPLNPTRGTFLTLNVLAAPQALGSDFDFVKEFAHLSLIRRFGRSPITWAHGYRVGLIQAFGSQRLPFDDLFKTGGPNSIRGYEIDTVGPLGPRNEALGGEAVVVVNQELRYQHERTGLGAAVFYDAGNVFPKVRDIDFDLLHSAGVGLRYSSPFGLFRVDVAFPLERRPGDRSYQINFGLGQAF